MSFLFKAWSYVGWLIVIAFVVLAIVAIAGGFKSDWSDPPV